MYVRTRPEDNARVLVTKEQTDQIEEEWAIATGRHDAYIAEKALRAKIRSQQRETFKKEPPESDVEWAYLNECRLQAGLENNWGLYRNFTFKMGEQLSRERRFKGALQHYLDVCYLDLNGPQNLGTRDPQWLRICPPFEPKTGFLAPGVISLIEDIMVKIDWDKEDVKRHFLEHNTRIGAGLKCPLAPEKCWPSIDEALGKR